MKIYDIRFANTAASSEGKFFIYLSFCDIRFICFNLLNELLSYIKQKTYFI